MCRVNAPHHRGALLVSLVLMHLLELGEIGALAEQVCRHLGLAGVPVGGNFE